MLLHTFTFMMFYMVDHANSFAHMILSSLLCSVLSQYLAVGDVPRELPELCLSLNFLSVGVNLNNSNEIRAVLCLLRSSPALQELHILVSFILLIRTSNNYLFLLILVINNQLDLLSKLEDSNAAELV